VGNSKNKRGTPMLVSASDDLKTAGLRVLAKLIAHDLVIKRQDNINTRNDKK
jgi:hypothetical protein